MSRVSKLSFSCEIKRCLFYFIQLFELKRLSTHDIGMKKWCIGFTVIPQSGHVVVSGKEYYDGPSSLFVFSLNDGKLNRKKISSSCDHIPRHHVLFRQIHVAVYTSSLIIDGREKLVVSCCDCDDLKLLDLQTGKWSTAFKGCKPDALCSGGSDTIFVQSWVNGPILQLDATSSVFKGPVRTLHTDIRCGVMCYIPPPIHALVLSDWFSSKMVALSVERDEVIWEFGTKLRCKSLYFHPEYIVLLVADGHNKRVLIVDPGMGGRIQDIDLSDMDTIYALSLYKDQIVM